MFFFPNAEAYLTAGFGRLARKIVPHSLSFGEEYNSHEIGKANTPRHRYDLELGDIVLTSTPGLAMQIGRTFTAQDHDHITVVVKPGKVLHIGPPKVRLLPISRVMEPRREPLVLRLKEFSGWLFHHHTPRPRHCSRVRIYRMTVSC